VEVLVTKTIRAAKRSRVHCITASGGVTCNRALRRELARACEREGFHLRLAENTFCTDNAAMVAVLAEYKLRHGVAETPLDAETQPGMDL
jgi:N6-L-threonylcarbamoyladenine synthase